MSQEQPPSPFPALLTFLFGAAMGAVVLALTTSKSGPTRRRELKDLVRRSRARAHQAIEGFRGNGRRSSRHFVWNAAPTKPGIHISVNDLPG
jgi:hypothetical protein